MTTSFPQTLADLVDGLTYKPGWSIRLVRGPVKRPTPVLAHDHAPGANPADGGDDLVLEVIASVADSRPPYLPTHVKHGLPVPTEAPVDWQRWLFDRLLDVETHEAMEFFAVSGRRPYAPSHEPGADHYAIQERA